MPFEARGTLATDAGMLVVWQPEAFASVVDYDSWEEELLEDDDLERHIRAGHLVPVDIGADGGYGVVARAGAADAPARLSGPEARYALVTSEPYLLVATGRALLSGLEHVGADPEARHTLAVEVPPGRRRVTVSIIDWERDPAPVGADGRPVPGALPDFAVLLDPEPEPAPGYRTALLTFDPPGGP